MAKKKRGDADNDRQLSTLQRRILVWIHKLELVYKDFQLEKNRLRELNQKGIPWSAKSFYNAAPTRSQEATLSGALRRLEKRGLVILYDSAGGLGEKPRTKHVRLTKAGAEVARFEREHGLTYRQLADLKRSEEKRRELWQLRRKWKQAEVDHNYDMDVFDREGGILFTIGHPGHDGMGTLFQEQYEREHEERKEALEQRIRGLETEMGEPHVDLQVPTDWSHSAAGAEAELQEFISEYLDHAEKTLRQNPNYTPPSAPDSADEWPPEESLPF